MTIIVLDLMIARLEGLKAQSLTRRRDGEYISKSPDVKQISIELN